MSTNCCRDERADSSFKKAGFFADVAEKAGAEACKEFQLIDFAGLGNVVPSCMSGFYDIFREKTGESFLHSVFNSG